MPPGSLTSHSGRNIFFSVSPVYIGLSLATMRTSFSIRRTFMNRPQVVDRYNLFACKSRSSDWREPAEKRRRKKRHFRTKKTFMDRAKTFDTFTRPPFSSRRSVSFEWITARHSSLIVYRLVHSPLPSVASDVCSPSRSGDTASLYSSFTTWSCYSLVDLSIVERYGFTFSFDCSLDIGVPLIPLISLTTNNIQLPVTRKSQLVNVIYFE